MPTSTIIAVIVSVPLLFQNVATKVCNVNQFIGVNNVGQPMNVCFQMTPSVVAPDSYDSESIDMIAGNWMIDTWTTSSTRISQLRSLDGSCTQWNSVEDEINQSSTTCETIN